MTPLRPVRPVRSPSRGSASDRFRRRRPRLLALGLVLSVVLHFLVLALGSSVTLPGSRAPAGELQAVNVTPPAPPPSVEIPPAPGPVSPPVAPATGGDGTPVSASRPAFIPHDVPPRLLNGEEVQRFLRRFYPPVLKALEVEGRVRLWLYLDEKGQVRETRVQRSSGHPAFDDLARTVATLMRFRPALSQGRTTPVWVSQPIRFETARDSGSAES